MYTLSTNEKLGMQVEQVRLAQIRQEIEARRLAADVQERGTLIQSLSSFVTVCKNHLSAKLPEQSTTNHTTTSQMGVFGKQ